MSIFDDVLNQDLPNRVRSNHALEHATLHVLQEQGNTSQLGGISDMGGFWIFGDVDTEILLLAARKARERLMDGESHLAVHPNCGTNIAVGALAAGGLAWMSMWGTKGKLVRRLLRMPLAVLVGLVGYKLAKPLGPMVQEQITTNADVSKMEIVEAVRQDVMGSFAHRVTTRAAK